MVDRPAIGNRFFYDIDSLAALVAATIGNRLGGIASLGDVLGEMTFEDGPVSLISNAFDTGLDLLDGSTVLFFGNRCRDIGIELASLIGTGLFNPAVEIETVVSTFNSHHLFLCAFHRQL